MKPAIFATVLAAASVLAISACTQPTGPRDTGNMAFPTPLPQGTLGTTTGTRATDTGNMAYPTPLLQGNIATTTGVRTPDTGGMASPVTPLSRGADTNGAQYQPNLPQGQVGTTRTTR